MKAVPLGQHSHLYAEHTAASTRSRGSGSQPVACVVSTTVRAPTRCAASNTAPVSAMRPSDDCTALHATTPVRGPTASASASSGTGRTTTPRVVWARKGNNSDVNSPSGITTSVAAGRLAATSPTKVEALGPTATDSGATPTNDANRRRASSAASFQVVHADRAVGPVVDHTARQLHRRPWRQAVGRGVEVPGPAPPRRAERRRSYPMSWTIVAATYRSTASALSTSRANSRLSIAARAELRIERLDQAARVRRSGADRRRVVIECRARPRPGSRWHRCLR